ncbi:hypothetical protein B7P43_G02202, partial [Cryptotermes secundus]
ASNMEWSKEDALRLIEAFKSFPVLWNPGENDYYKKNKISDAWRDIAMNVGRPEDDCQRRIICLLLSYQTEKLREIKSIATGKGSSEVYCSRWFAYEALRFLEDRVKPRPRIDTVS